MNTHADFDRANREITNMLRSLSNDISGPDAYARRHEFHRRGLELSRQIEQVNMNLTRLRATEMRRTFEQRLARQDEERRNRTRTDSDSSSSSDDSDLDLDSFYPLDSYTSCSSSTQTQSSSSSDAQTSSSSSSSVDTSSLMEIGEATISEKPKLCESANSSGSEPSPSSASSSSSSTEEAQTCANKRKTSNVLEEAPPAKRSMATSTDESYFQKC